MHGVYSDQIVEDNNYIGVTGASRNDIYFVLILKREFDMTSDDVLEGNEHRNNFNF